MPELSVNFYASLRKIAGTKTVDLQLPAQATISNILEAVINRYPQMQIKLLNENGQLDRRAHIYVNGRNCLLLEKGLEASPNNEDAIDIFPIGHF
jgi:MoaD family protein